MFIPSPAPTCFRGPDPCSERGAGAARRAVVQLGVPGGSARIPSVHGCVCKRRAPGTGAERELGSRWRPSDTEVSAGPGGAAPRVLSLESGRIRSILIPSHGRSRPQPFWVSILPDPASLPPGREEGVLAPDSVGHLSPVASWGGSAGDQAGSARTGVALAVVSRPPPLRSLHLKGDERHGARFTR